MFQKFDVDRNGKIDKKEMENILKSFHHKVTKRTIDKIFQIADADDNGTIELNEFIASMRTILGDRQQQARETFNMFDVDHNGTIDKSELSEAFKVLGENLSNTEIDMILEEYDLDKSGAIDFQEFWKMMKSLGL